MDVKRFSRQIIIEEFGIEGQLLLNRSKVLIIGLGGLGSPVSIYLALAGVGKLGLFDFDKVDLSNLQRQPLFFEEDVGSYKVDIAKKRLKEYNKNIQLEIYKDYFDIKYKDIFKDYDLIVDCTDNIPTRKMINQASLEMGKPFLYCSIDQFSLQISLLNYNNGPCYECLFPDLENSSLMSCVDRGVLGPVAGIAGLYQTLEAIKYLSNMNFLKNQILFIDLLKYKQLKLAIEKNKNCKCNQYYKNQEIKNTKKEYNISYITIDELPLRSNEYVILDLRTEEQNNKNLYNKINLNNKKIYKIDLKELPYKAGQLPSDKDIIILCSSGARARQAAILLQQLNYSSIYCLQLDEFLL
ncbi:MAG: molybdenum cofactor biosynthesis protein MoeB [Leptospiraceae bacterium]|nr:MAG: molybdenum cofactor biosynthesis protein MoeB [Leptospiraceae bacterium]